MSFLNLENNVQQLTWPKHLNTSLKRFKINDMYSIKTIKWLRYSGIAEGISSLLLFFVGMPLKYLADKPEAVRITGTIHGILFVIYVVTLMQAALVLNRPLSWSVKIFVAAIIPMGPFMIEPSLKREQKELLKRVKRLTESPLGIEIDCRKLSLSPHFAAVQLNGFPVNKSFSAR